MVSTGAGCLLAAHTYRDFMIKRVAPSGAGRARSMTQNPLNRHTSILATLATLLLASCEPGQDHAGTGSAAPGKPEGGMATKFRDRSNADRIAAGDSIGKPPVPRNLLADVESTCPLHPEAMKAREIPIVFADAASGAPDPSDMQATAEFPFGAEKIISSGNALLPTEPISAHVYQCAACVAGRRASEARRTVASPR